MHPLQPVCNRQPPLANRLTTANRHSPQIKRDDYEIEREGLENLTEEELRQVG